MDINADYSKRVVINHHDLTWIPSPESGVERRLLERTGDEVAKATSIVRYQPGSKFQTHTHEFGEEILVLDGVFSDEAAPQTYFNSHRHHGGEEIFVVDGVFEDEYGRYRAGSWIRSPHMSLHQPFSKDGCTIFVKTGHLLN
jgi:anti-sigma factor ChrR (cupin superfamily)